MRTRREAIEEGRPPPGDADLDEKKSKLETQLTKWQEQVEAGTAAAPPQATTAAAPVFFDLTGMTGSYLYMVSHRCGPRPYGPACRCVSLMACVAPKD
jgi:hypothetical protein